MGFLNDRNLWFSQGFHKGQFWDLYHFIYYMLSLKIIKKHNISYHADNTRMYIFLSSDYVSPIHKLVNCINNIKYWMSRILQLNKDKTEILVWKVGLKNQTGNLFTARITVSVRDLRVILDLILTLKVMSVTWAGQLFITWKTCC